MFTAMNITDSSQKRATLMYYVGDDTCDIFNTLTVPDATEDMDSYKQAIKVLSNHFEQQKCLDHHIYVFRKEHQKTNQSVSDLYIRLQRLAKKYEFPDASLELKRQVIQGTTSTLLRMKAIEEIMALEKSCHSYADKRTSEIENNQVHNIEHRKAVSKANMIGPRVNWNNVKTEINMSFVCWHLHSPWEVLGPGC